MQRIKALFKDDRFREIFTYLVIGGLTTALYYVVYFVSTRLIGLLFSLGFENSLLITVGTGIAWVAGVCFAYWANKRFVFRSLDWSREVLKREIPSFVTARVLSLLFDLGFTLLAVKHWGMNDLIAKAISQVVVILVNYVASKFWIFRKEDADRERK